MALAFQVAQGDASADQRVSLLMDLGQSKDSAEEAVHRAEVKSAAARAAEAIRSDVHA